MQRQEETERQEVMSDSIKHFEDGRARLQRIYQAHREGRIKDVTRAANLCNSVIDNVRKTNGEKAVREIQSEMRSKKLM